MNRANDSAESDAAVTADAVLAFWFGEGEQYGRSRIEWFKKDAAFDDEIRKRFLVSYELAASGRLSAWKESSQTCLALIILLDQFPRNMFRNTARAFSTDRTALDATLHALENRFDRELKPVERQFVYLPLEHSESLIDQETCLKLMQQLSGFNETAQLHVWAEKHLVIIRRFGRFPHRNATLGRESTPEEVEFLKQPGSGF